jgi:arsenate reductase (thioredoxin)
VTNTLRRELGRLVSLVLAVSSIAAGAPGMDAPRKGEASGTVVFVCEHGNVKSLIAREWFNRLARERGLSLRAVSRGVTPEKAIPPAIADALRRDGFDVSAFEPRAFSAADASSARRVVGIGVDLAASGERGDAPLDTWDGIPPASEHYAASRDAMRTRIEALLKALEPTGRPD